MALDLCRGWEEELSTYLERGPGQAQLRALLDPARTPAAVHRSLGLNACAFSDACGQVVMAILLEPESVLAGCDRILAAAAERLVPSGCRAGARLHLRLEVLPPFPDFVRETVPRSEDVGLLLSIRGTAIKTGRPKVVEDRRRFRCGQCGYETLAAADFEQFFRLAPPRMCPNPERACPNTGHWTPVGQLTPEFCHDYQEIKIQEQVSNLHMGSMPRSIWVALSDDLVDLCQPGDDVTVIGVVKRRWREMGRGRDGRTDIELCLRANHIRVNNDQQARHLVSEEQALAFERFWAEHAHCPLLGRNRILASFCPQVYGLYAIKLALAVVMCGGVERVDESGTRVRGECHMLMVGDPGTGKSQLLRYAAKLAPRSVLTTGIGSTCAGLTVSAVKEGGEWHLEAGALVLADGGVCCIDEFNSIREADRTSIHEAMEQQSLSVAKAGLVCKLQSRCSILAATNPKGHYDSDQPLTLNVGIASPLLSRFDLVFTLLDAHNETWDRIVSGYLLQGQDPTTDLSPGVYGQEKWSFDKVQAYFVHCKRLNPDLSDSAIEVLSRYYQIQRTKEDSNMARTTVRMLQSAIRLAQGHARLMQKKEVDVMDSVYAVILLEISSDSSSTLLNGVNPLHMAFPEDPWEEYKAQAKIVLAGLDLEHLWTLESQRGDEMSKMGTCLKSNISVPSVTPSNVVNTAFPPDMMTQVITKLRSNQLNFGALSDCVIGGPKRKRKQEEGKRRPHAKDRSKKRKASPRHHDISESSSEETDDLECDISSEEKPKSQVRAKKTNIEPVTSTQLVSGEEPQQDALDVCALSRIEIPSPEIVGTGVSRVAEATDSCLLSNTSIIQPGDKCPEATFEVLDGVQTHGTSNAQRQQTQRKPGCHGAAQSFSIPRAKSNQTQIFVEEEDLDILESLDFGAPTIGEPSAGLNSGLARDVPQASRDEGAQVKEKSAKTVYLLEEDFVDFDL